MCSSASLLQWCAGCVVRAKLLRLAEMRRASRHMLPLATRCATHMVSHPLPAVTPAAAGPSSAKDAGRKRGRDPPSPLQRQPLQELMVSGGGQQQQAQRRRQQPEQAPAPQPAAGSGAGTWLKNAAHRP